ncbi:hypothetical protein CDAR_399491 [Caerostris darwini]|uniref:C2 domain-containing protein n=1 Tax=Caerostris darwini TaxID=1538125 RepID=A0AAV4SWR9_9ARAC|nr:hypothetical protein CDAR_399491 [Caerostris darwini]
MDISNPRWNTEHKFSFPERIPFILRNFYCHSLSVDLKRGVNSPPAKRSWMTLLKDTGSSENGPERQRVPVRFLTQFSHAPVATVGHGPAVRRHRDSIHENWPPTT